MNRALLLTVALAALTLGACSKKEDDINSLPPGGVDDSPERVAPARAPDPGTYTGLETRYGRRPPLSGINSDPANPNGAPGTR